MYNNSKNSHFTASAACANQQALCPFKYDAPHGGAFVYFFESALNQVEMWTAPVSQSHLSTTE